MIDLHTHLLPGVDDGAETIEQSVAVLAQFKKQGVSTLCCTPHLKASEFGQAPCHELDELLEELRTQAGDDSPRLVRGFEIMLDLPAPVINDRCLTLNGTRYILVEFGRLVPADPSVEVLQRITDQGFIPVLAHPERYAVCSVALAERWRGAGAVLQLDATTLMSESKRADRARDLLIAGLASIIASDNHGDGRNLAASVDWIARHGGPLQAQLLSSDNPAAILADRAVMPVPPMRIRRSWYTKLKDFVIGGAEA